MTKPLDLFLAKKWDALLAALKTSRKAESRFLRTWCELELGESASAVAGLKVLHEGSLESCAKSVVA